MKLAHVGAIAIAVALVAGVVAVAATRAAPPARCAEGMIAIGPRCCGEGQRLEGESCRGAPTRCARDLLATPEGCRARDRRVRIERGVLSIGPSDWEAQGVVASRETPIASFDIDAYEVTEARWTECVAAQKCAALTMSGEPGRAMVGMTLEEAREMCRFAGGRVPTADELAFAASGPAGHRYPWGETGAVCRRAAWGLVDGPCGTGARGPEVAGSRPDGATPEGVLDLAGNVAEWATSLPELAETRGGSWATLAASGLRTWHRESRRPDERSREVGTRCVYAP